MRVELRDVSKGDALPTVTLAFETGAATLALTETERRPTVLGLLASGRMKAETGTITVDSHPDTARMRAAIALVDAPVVSEPSPDVTLAAVAAEELMFAGLRSHPFAVARRLDALGVGAYGKTAMADLPALARIRVLCELALLRGGIDAIVLVSPDRHGGDPADWWAYARELAERGLAVLVIAGTAAASALAANDLIRVSTGPAPEAERTATLDELFTPGPVEASASGTEPVEIDPVAPARTVSAPAAAPSATEPTPSDDGAGTDDDPTGDEK